MSGTWKLRFTSNSISRSGAGLGAGKLPVSGRPTTFAYSRTGPAVLAAGAERMDGIAFLFNIFHLSSRSYGMSFGRRLNKIERAWFRLANSNGSWQLLPGTSSQSTG